MKTSNARGRIKKCERGGPRCGETLLQEARVQPLPLDLSPLPHPAKRHPLHQGTRRVACTAFDQARRGMHYGLQQCRSVVTASGRAADRQGSGLRSSRPRAEVSLLSWEEGWVFQLLEELVRGGARASGRLCSGFLLICSTQ